MAEERFPGRFRRRLALTFILVIALTAGVVAAVTVVVASQSRLRNFRAEAIAEAQFTAAVAPTDLDDDTFERLRLGYESRSDANLLAVSDDAVFSSARNLDTADIPPVLREPIPPGEMRTLEATVNGRPTFIVAARTPGGDEYYSFFSMVQLRDSREELTRTAAGVWFVALLAASAIAWWVTRRVLRPVAAVASTAEAIASGDLSARLPAAGGDDELGALSTSFNHMADEVERMIVRLEAAAERERRFTADVAHELRTPLTGMSASAAILRDQLDDMPERLRRPASILVGDVSRLRDLVLELLELARLDAGEEAPRVERLRLRDAFSSVARSLDALDRFQLRVDPDLAVLADPIRLQRILTNLATNVLRHGGGAATVTAERDGETAELHVVDVGPGLGPGEEERVFDRFYKSAQSRAAGGSGLGLAISRQHARSLGGDLVAANEPGGGARFTLSLPAAPEATADDDPLAPRIAHEIVTE